ncbi:spermidine/putrescine ABC transporter permease PotB [Desulfotignum phosphitoxidans]|uniref:Spermidine/putrescine ABC transporter, permease protein PotB n=1 Tax=Desulfotignum phosphitoxidans DSM 13687 TaxID=1286635 RepID=S0G0X6_9BACT|nr:spermidine/putrescine ABC transporter permease PotB [Desulfotignum phosphitoxidans]EMS79094.1 spermidine/putrescine ABC transporter, permease protein PotB [Desulfotignum phosphitoxidans DSM 13687]
MNERQGFKFIAVFLNMAWFASFVLIPGLMVVGISFMTRDTGTFFSPPLTLTQYRELLDPVYAKVLGASLIYSLNTTLLCLFISYPFAWILSRASKHRRPLLLMMVIIPFWTSSLIRTYALVILMKANGIINTLLSAAGIVSEPVTLLYTDFAVYVGLVYSLLPFMILPLYAVMEKMDLRLLEAARDLGANTLQVFVHVVLPLSFPGVLAGCIMVFLPAMGLFYVPDLLGGAKTMLMGNFIKNQFLTAMNWPFGSAASVFLLVLMGLMLIIYFTFSRRFNRHQAL